MNKSGLQFLEVSERFLPIKKTALREKMLADPRLSSSERDQLGKLFELIEARFHFEFRQKLERLKDLYDAFDPDIDVLPAASQSNNLAVQREELSQAFTQLLLDANYVELPCERIVACAEFQSQVTVSVKANLSDYAQLRVFYRGVRHEMRTVRLLLRPWRHRKQVVHVFSRVALLVRLARHPEKPVYLKLFKDVIAEDLEMLLPYVRIQMRWLDHVKIGSSVLGGIATAIVKVLTAATLAPWVLLLILLGFFSSAIRCTFSYFSHKTKYMQALSSNLYFQNLANNGSTLTQLVDCAEVEECKELLLAYYILYLERDRDYTQHELDRRVEEWLRTEFRVVVDFEVSDAVRDLVDKELLVCHPPKHASDDAATAVLKVFDLPSALRRVDAALDDCYAYNGSRPPELDRLAEGNWPPLSG